MIRSMFSGVAGLRAHQSKMDTIGNNIANVNTFGYKSMTASFKESIYSTNRASANGNTTTGGRNASQIGYGSQVNSVDLLFTPGNYSPTDDPMHCMIDGQGLFLLGAKGLGGDADLDAGDIDFTKFLLSRVGDFKIDGQGFLVNSEGQHVYGFTPEDDDGTIGTTLGAIRVPDVDGNPYEDDGAFDPTADDERMILGNISIDPYGVITGINSETEEVVVIGVIAVANIPNPNGLQKTQGPYYKAIANTGTVTAHVPGKGSTGSLVTNGLEMANVDLAKEFSEMITTQRGFQANTRIITVSDQMLEELMAMKR